MNRIHIEGIQGVGKDSVIEKISDDYGLEVINFAEMMKKTAKANYSHDALLRELTGRERVSLRAKVFEELAIKHIEIANMQLGNVLQKSLKVGDKYES